MVQRFFLLVLICMAAFTLPTASQELTWNMVTSPAEGAIGFTALFVTSRGSLIANLGAGTFARSTDNGGTWKSMITPANGLAASLIVGEDGLIYLLDPVGNVWVSNDDGDSFSLLVTLHDVEYPSLFVARNGDLHIFSNGLMSSSDRGVTWRSSLNEGIPICMASDRAGRLYVGVLDSGVYRSEDRGTSWKRTGLNDGYTRVVLPTSSGFVLAGVQYLGGIGGTFVSGDNGDSWSSTPLHDVVAAMTATPTGVVYAAGANSGIYRSDDNGQSWRQYNNGLTDVRMLQVVLHPSGHLFAANAFGQVFRSSRAVYVADVEKGSSPFVGEIKVLSDPTSRSIRVRATALAGASLHLSLYNALGERVRAVDLEVSVGTSETSVDIGDIPSGTYVYGLSNGRGIVSGITIRY